MIDKHTELIKRLRNPDDYFFFKGPKQMNAILTGLCQEAADALEASEGAALPTMQDALNAGDAIIARESAVLPLTAPVTDDEIDAAFEALDLLRESTTVPEMRRALEGFAAGRAAAPEADAKAEAAHCCGTCVAFPLYTAPQPVVLRPMTKPEIADMTNKMGAFYDGDYDEAIVRATEKHHGITGAA
jgi:hypothetical protein